MKSYYLVSYNHNTHEWLTETTYQQELMPDGFIRDGDNLIRAPWGTQQQEADSNGLILLFHHLRAMTKGNRQVKATV